MARVHDGGVVLGSNERVRNLDIEVLSDHWYVLRKVSFDYRHRDGTWSREVREAYDRGNGVTILLYDPDAATVLLTRQFRLPAFVNGHPDGMLIETAAGLLDGDDPEAAIRREAEEESGVRVGAITPAVRAVHEPRLGDRAGHVLRRHVLPRPAGLGRRRPQPPRARTSRCSSSRSADALAMVERGEIADGKTVLLLQWAQLQAIASARR